MFFYWEIRLLRFSDRFLSSYEKNGLVAGRILELSIVYIKYAYNHVNTDPLDHSLFFSML